MGRVMVGRVGAVPTSGFVGTGPRYGSRRWLRRRPHAVIGWRAPIARVVAIGLLATAVLAFLLAPGAGATPPAATSATTASVSFAPGVGYPMPSAESAILVAEGPLDTKDHAANVDDVVTGSNTGNITVFINNGDGTFKPGVDYSVGGAQLAGLAVADVNGDGHMDVIATVNGWGADISVFLGLGNGELQAPYTVPSGYPGGEPFSMAVGDFTGSGRTDIALGFSPGGADNDRFNILANDGTGHYSLLGVYGDGSTYTSTSSITAGHIVNKTVDDLVVADEGGCCGGTATRVYVNNGTGGFTESASMSASTTGYGRHVAIADFNGDGNADLAIGPDGNPATVFFGDGNGNFPTSTSVTFPGGASAMFTADFNGDGKPDLTAGTQVAAGNGDGSFQAPITADGGGSGVATGPLTPSGVPDIATVGGDLVIDLNTTPPPVTGCLPASTNLVGNPGFESSVAPSSRYPATPTFGNWLPYNNGSGVPGLGTLARCGKYGGQVSGGYWAQDFPIAASPAAQLGGRLHQLLAGLLNGLGGVLGRVSRTGAPAIPAPSNAFDPTQPFVFGFWFYPTGVGTQGRLVSGWDRGMVTPPTSSRWA